jgi:hypothetical protein
MPMNRLVLILSIYFLRNLLIRYNNHPVENSHESEENFFNSSKPQAKCQSLSAFKIGKPW